MCARYAQTNSHRHPQHWITQHTSSTHTHKKNCRNNENKNTSVRAIFMSFFLSLSPMKMFAVFSRARGWRRKWRDTGGGRKNKMKRRRIKKKWRENINTYFCIFCAFIGRLLAMHTVRYDFHHCLPFAVWFIGASSSAEVVEQCRRRRRWCHFRLSSTFKLHYT